MYYARIFQADCLQDAEKINNFPMVIAQEK
jgi:hypothetical protein